MPHKSNHRTWRGLLHSAFSEQSVEFFCLYTSLTTGSFDICSSPLVQISHPILFQRYVDHLVSCVFIPGSPVKLFTITCLEFSLNDLYFACSLSFTDRSNHLVRGIRLLTCVPRANSPHISHGLRETEVDGLALENQKAMIKHWRRHFSSSFPCLAFFARLSHPH